jgi:putative membrane protein
MSESSILEHPIQVEKARKLRVVVWIVSAVVLLLVALMRSPYKLDVPPEYEIAHNFIKALPEVMALINTFVAACLLAGILAILKKKQRLHQRLMKTALILSSIFLVFYVVYHFTTFETKFGDADGDGQLSEGELAKFGNLRMLYLGVLITHIIAAAVSFPMILMTFVHAWTRDFVKHRKLAKKTFPLWLYVAVTGPFCYWMLKAFYQ